MRSSRGVTPDGIAAVALVLAGAAVSGTASAVAMVRITMVVSNADTILVYFILVGDFSKQTLPDSVSLY